MGKYKRFGETRAETIILDEWIEMRWNPRNKKRLTNLGYTFTSMRDSFMCRIDDLSMGATVEVKIKCPVCLQARFVVYGNMIKTGHTLCLGCSNIIDISGLAFGKWTVVSFDCVNERSARWLCRCECGVLKSVSSHNLMDGSSKSCGCSRLEPGKYSLGKHPNWKGGPIALECEFCKEEYQIRRGGSRTSRFCSTKCHDAWRSENKSGPNSPFWDHGKTDEERIVQRKYPEYRQYIKSVMKRDNYQCQVCGATHTELEVHHLYSYAHYPEHALNVDYGIVVCKDQHKEFHSWMGGNGVECTPADFDRWLYETSCLPRK